MNDLRYILNLPIEIDTIGKVHPFTMKEYALYSHYLNVLTVTVNLCLQQIDSKDTKMRAAVTGQLKAFDLICWEPELLQLLLLLLTTSFKPKRLKYCSALHRILINDGIIDRDNYDDIRSQIIKINNIKLPKQANNKELQQWFDKSYALRNSQNKNSGDMEDVITSIMAFTGYTPEQLRKMTVYQVNQLIARLNKISEYKANIQYLCAGAEGIKLEHWSNKINEEDAISSDFDSFTNTFQSIIK